jgi:phosphoribosylglycinamide formyltransferase 1
MSIHPKARLAVLASGNGSNLQAIIDACEINTINAKVVVVASDQKEALALQRARLAEIPALTQVKAKEVDRKSYDEALARDLLAYEPDWVVLAGWMRILSAPFLNHFPNKVINIHPALPGTFPGTHAIERAFEAFHRGEISYTGVMVHLVPDERVDCGPVLGCEIVNIYPDDTLETFATRVHMTEHELFVKTLSHLVNSQSTPAKVNEKYE